MDSPFAKFINTNWAPSESEIPTVEALIKERQHVVDRMDEEIQKIGATLSDLKESQEVHLKYIQDHKSFLSPVKRLPVDLLSAIFLACRISMGPSARVPSNMTKYNPAVIISHVCRQWRHISLNTPLLWADIHVSPPGYPRPNPTGLPPYAIPHNHMDVHRRRVERWESNIARERDVLKVWISRSGGCSLSLGLSTEDIAWSLGPLNGTGEDDTTIATVQKYLAELVDILCHTSMRWMAIDFTFTITAYTTSLLRLLLLSPDQLPLLKAFHFRILFLITGNDQTLQEQKRILIPNMGGFQSPSLRSLTISWLWSDITTIPVDWSSLTALSFLGYKPDVFTGPGMSTSPSHLPRFGGKEALALLKACRRLIYCSLLLQSSYSSVTPHPIIHTDPPLVEVVKNISLPFLQVLTIQGSAVPNGFASSLVLPSLRTLNIVQQPPIPLNEDDSGVVDFIRCFGDQLTNVSFSYSALTSSALLYSLEHLPNVTDLGLASQPPGSLMRSHSPNASQPPALITPDVLARLTPQSSDDDSSSYDPLESCFCPKLQHFVCSLNGLEFKERDLIKFIAARRGSRTLGGASSGSGCGGDVVRIQKIYVTLSSYQEMDIEDELMKQNVDTGGLVLKVVYPLEKTFPPHPISVGFGDNHGDSW